MVLKGHEKIKDGRINYFYLAHGLLSLECLGNLAEAGIPPELVIVHSAYEYEKLKDVFYGKISRLCGEYGIRLHRTKKLGNEPDITEGYAAGICAGFMEIISEEIFSKPEYGILNLHCGKLPEYRGRAPICRTIMDGRQSLTITLHKIDSGVDSGDILLEKEIPVLPEDDVNTMYRKCSETSHIIVAEGLEKLRSGSSAADMLFRKQADTDKFSPHRKLTEEELKIDWSCTTERIHNLIRAVTSPYPCARTVHNGNTYLILRAAAGRKAGGFREGCIAKVNKEGITVNCIDGSVLITEIADINLNKIKPENIFSEGEFFE